MRGTGSAEGKSPAGQGAGGPVVVFSGGGTGGHLYPALALADALRERRPGVRAVFVGARRGLEARVLPERGEEHVLLPVVGFTRDEPLWRRIGAVVPLARSVGRVVGAFRNLRPEVVVVTGGYAGGPAALGGALLGMPLVLQEQNAEPGLVTRVASRWAREIHVAFPEAVKRLPDRARDRARVSGNPVRPPEERDPEAARRSFGLEPRGPVVLAVGGSQGSRPLNRALTEAVRDVRAGRLRRPSGLQLLWSTGPAHLEEVRRSLGSEAAGWVRVTGYIDDMPGALAAADLAVSRAGAMATSEFLAWSLPAVLVPLPGAAAGHQERNARALAEAGAAVHMPQAELDGPALWEALVDIVEVPDRLEAMARAASRRGRPDAAREIAGRIEALLPPSFPLDREAP